MTRGAAQGTPPQQLCLPSIASWLGAPPQPVPFVKQVTRPTMPVPFISKTHSTLARVRHRHRSPGEAIYFSFTPMPSGGSAISPVTVSDVSRSMLRISRGRHRSGTRSPPRPPAERAGSELGPRGCSAPAPQGPARGEKPRLDPEMCHRKSSPSRRSRVGRPFRRAWGDEGGSWDHPSCGAAAEPNFGLGQHLLRRFAAALLGFRHDQVNDEGKGKYYYHYYCYYYYSLFLTFQIKPRCVVNRSSLLRSAQPVPAKVYV